MSNDNVRVYTAIEICQWVKRGDDIGRPEKFYSNSDYLAIVKDRDIMKKALERIIKSICNPTSMTDARFQLGAIERFADKAINRGAK